MGRNLPEDDFIPVSPARASYEWPVFRPEQRGPHQKHCHSWREGDLSPFIRRGPFRLGVVRISEALHAEELPLGRENVSTEALHEHQLAARLLDFGVEYPFAVRRNREAVAQGSLKRGDVADVIRGEA